MIVILGRKLLPTGELKQSRPLQAPAKITGRPLGSAHLWKRKLLCQKRDFTLQYDTLKLEILPAPVKKKAKNSGARHINITVRPVRGVRVAVPGIRKPDGEAAHRQKT